MVDTADEDRLDGFADLFERVVDSIGTVVHGKRDVIELAVISLVAGGHLLIDDVPGVGKTSLAKALASSVDCTWNRIQFTPDLLPSDLVGVNVYERSTETFRFVRGPLFAQIVLADEINRASPKTQSALLEAMEEHQVSSDSATHRLPTPFMVIATQNPVEQEGTYRLPESQLDRFLLRISIGYPDRDAEMTMLAGANTSGLDDAGTTATGSVISSSQVSDMIADVRRIHIADAVKGYLIDLADASRRHPSIRLGLSPRATLQLAAACRGHAAARGRDFVTPDDVKVMAPPTLAHRLLPDSTDSSRRTTEAVVHDLLEHVPVPTVR